MWSEYWVRNAFFRVRVFLLRFWEEKEEVLCGEGQFALLLQTDRFFIFLCDSIFLSLWCRAVFCCIFGLICEATVPYLWIKWSPNSLYSLVSTFVSFVWILYNCILVSICYVLYLHHTSFAIQMGLHHVALICTCLKLLFCASFCHLIAGFFESSLPWIWLIFLCVIGLGWCLVMAIIILGHGEEHKQGLKQHLVTREVWSWKKLTCL